MSIFISFQNHEMKEAEGRTSKKATGRFSWLGREEQGLRQEHQERRE
jgi:hypothetical protein